MQTRDSWDCLSRVMHSSKMYFKYTFCSETELFAYSVRFNIENKGFQGHSYYKVPHSTSQAVARMPALGWPSACCLGLQGQGTVPDTQKQA